MKECICKVVAKVIGEMGEEQIQGLLETPPDSSMGDIAIPCFSFAKVTYELVKALGGYENAIKSAAIRYEPSVIARYLVSLSTAFNKFYQECKILKEENESTKTARLYLVSVVQKIITQGCSLLGIQCPEEM